MGMVPKNEETMIKCICNACPTITNVCRREKWVYFVL